MTCVYRIPTKALLSKSPKGCKTMASRALLTRFGSCFRAFGAQVDSFMVYVKVQTTWAVSRDAKGHMNVRILLLPARPVYGRFQQFLVVIKQSVHPRSQTRIRRSDRGTADVWALAALYYTILYYTILYYTILYYTILYYTILYYTILYYTILYYTILYYTILYYTILYYTILYYTILYYTILYYTILYYTILYYTILYHTILYYTLLYYAILYTSVLLRPLSPAAVAVPRFGREPRRRGRASQAGRGGAKDEAS